MNIAIATGNSLKIEGVRDGFSRMFPGEEINMVPRLVNSKVGRQPIEGETMQGAKNRLKELEKIAFEEEIAYFCACEAGIFTSGGFWFNQHVILIKRKKDGKIVAGKSQAFQIPTDRVMDVINSDLKEVLGENGGITKLSKGILSRVNLISDGIVATLSGFNW